ncbi:hypothetical protein ANCDUO_27252, partial [Ancylostoma duodenale]
RTPFAARTPRSASRPNTDATATMTVATTRTKTRSTVKTARNPCAPRKNSNATTIDASQSSGNATRITIVEMVLMRSLSFARMPPVLLISSPVQTGGAYRSIGFVMAITIVMTVLMRIRSDAHRCSAGVTSS